MDLKHGAQERDILWAFRHKAEYFITRWTCTVSGVCEKIEKYVVKNKKHILETVAVIQWNKAHVRILYYFLLDQISSSYYLVSCSSIQINVTILWVCVCECKCMSKQTILGTTYNCKNHIKILRIYHTWHVKLQYLLQEFCIKHVERFKICNHTWPIATECSTIKAY